MSNQEAPDALVEARRRFLANCGKFAVATPPIVTLMLADAKEGYAGASSGGGRGGHYGGGHHDGGRYRDGHHGGWHHGRHGGDHRGDHSR